MECDYTRKDETNICNRQDQSVLNILMRNMEYQLYEKGFKIIGRENGQHPINDRPSRHLVVRCQKPKGNEKLSC